MAGEAEHRGQPQTALGRARDFIRGAGIGTAKLLALCHTLETHYLKFDLDCYREDVVISRNKRSVWDRLTGKTTIEIVRAESNLRIAELRTAAIETETQSRDVGMEGYRNAQFKVTEVMDDLTSESSKDNAIETLSEIADEIIRPNVRIDLNH